MTPMKRLAWAAAAVAVAVTLIACGSGDGVTSSSPGTTAAATAQAQATTVKVGQALTLTTELLGSKDSVTVTVTKAATYAKEPGDYGSKPERGRFLTITVTVQVTAGTYLANPFDFRVVGTDGTVYESALASIGTALHSTSLAAGQKTTGTVTFDVPEKVTTTGKVQINGIGLDSSNPAGFWTLG